MKISALIFGLVSLFLSLFYISDHVDLKYPKYFPKPRYDLEKNILTKSKIELGRALFYDPVLSLDSTISCASCHSPYNAFAHTDHGLSHGINDQINDRNAIALFNLAWNESFMWDGAIPHLDVQSLAPITHPREMGETIENVVSKLQRIQRYQNAFYQAFGDSLITGEYTLKALAQFQLTLISSDSRYDQMKQGVIEFTEQEQKGYALFRDNCNSCHSEPLFTNYKYESNGLSVDTILQDIGRGRVSMLADDNYKFKVPSLRNLSFTYPYMHDGRFRKLKEVVAHYNGRVLDQGESAITQEMIDLSEEDRVDLISFLLSLDDRNFVFDPKNKFPKDFLLNNEGSGNK